MLQLEDLGLSTASWLLAQREAWRERTLDTERRLMLQLAGVRLEVCCLACLCCSLVQLGYAEGLSSPLSCCWPVDASKAITKLALLCSSAKRWQPVKGASR